MNTENGISGLSWEVVDFFIVRALAQVSRQIGGLGQGMGCF